MPTQAELDAARAEAAQDALARKRIDDLEEVVKELKADRDKFLRWGIIVLGGAVIGLGTWVFKLITTLVVGKH